jgi:hypothetical protein
MVKPSVLLALAKKFSQSMTHALTLMHLFQRVMYPDSKLSAGFTAQNLIYVRVMR